MRDDYLSKRGAATDATLRFRSLVHRTCNSKSISNQTWLFFFFPDLSFNLCQADSYFYKLCKLAENNSDPKWLQIHLQCWKMLFSLVKSKVVFLASVVKLYIMSVFVLCSAALCRILASCTDLMQAIKELVLSSKNLQRDIVESGRVSPETFFVLLLQIVWPTDC